MIQISLPTPPSNYESEVKNPGEVFLRSNPNPTNQDWKNHRYWQKVHDYLYSELSGICLYCASWTPRRQQAGTIDHTSIDHFTPKSSNAQLAYEWTNFRMCRSRLNNYKADFRDILDPCTVSDDWFYLDFTSFLIKPSPNVTENNLKHKIINTIDRLRLNSDDDYVTERIRVVKEYSFDNLSLNVLQEKFPFIALQMSKQDFDQRYKNRLRQLFQRINFH